MILSGKPATDTDQADMAKAAKELIQHMFGRSMDECIPILWSEEAIKGYCSKYNSAQPPNVTLKQMLWLKDQLRIPDSKWPTIVETFHLPNGLTLHYIRKLRQAMAQELKALPTSTGHGAELSIHLTWLLKTKPPTSDTVKVKFAFDGAIVTSGKRKEQVVGSLELLSDRTLSEVKSYKNANQWIIYLGSEDYDEMAKEFETGISVINQLNEEKKVYLILFWLRIIDRC